MVHGDLTTRIHRGAPCRGNMRLSNGKHSESAIPSPLCCCGSKLAYIRNPSSVFFSRDFFSLILMKVICVYKIEI